MLLNSQIKAYNQQIEGLTHVSTKEYITEDALIKTKEIRPL